MRIVESLYRRAAWEMRFNQRGRDEWVAGRARSLGPGTTILDVGAGTGRYRHLFDHCTYRSQDFMQYEGTPEGLLTETFVYAKIDYVGDAMAIPVPDGSFDAVLCTEVLEHVPEPTRVIQEIGRILRPGGRLFLTAPLGSSLHQEPYHFYGGYTPYFYRRFLPEARLKVVSIEANGGFFRHLLQETMRAGQLLQELRAYPRWHPLRLVIRYGLLLLMPLWLARLDDRHRIEAFTVGYFVEAVRQ